MLPLINGKEIIACSEEDFEFMIDNPDFRECEELEYKKCFDYLLIDDKQIREKKKVEFKCDICSFANANGGNIIYGIEEKDGCAHSITGIDIDNIDKFELNRRNDLSGIKPRVPNVEIKIIPLKNGKYVVVISVKHDGYAPYVYLEDEKQYRIYRRSGNCKAVISYSELRQMFSNSMSLDKAVYDYLDNRVKHYLTVNNVCGDKFIHLCFIPETFCDPHYLQNMFLIERERNIDFETAFNAFSHISPSIPCVDGIRFVSLYDDKNYSECYAKNNGILEICYSLLSKINNNYLAWGKVWENISDTCLKCLHLYKDLGRDGKVFICLSIVGCQQVKTDTALGQEYIGEIDRNIIICEPISVDINDEEDNILMIIKQLYLIYMLSIGIKHKQQLKDLIKELKVESDEGRICDV